ncbi:hypothetical protein [Pseudonocardia broussonetiae]|uniref:Uncharacterized protein n=1 Tax=Pseudonocardia broussonetiae TaxID=2736640 RepID=A0A6M6JG50_9PSEU|nr:hypothetical protein [Pseudonocardia broussonetiae]QJY46125.1 hypothetical protein HOP40_10170 [Pseudonocardia broussonetiae]
MNPFASPLAAPGPADVDAWRSRWRAAGEALFPTLMTDPPSYAGAVETIGALAAELGRRRADLPALVAAMTDPDAFLAECGRRPSAVPATLLVGVACGMRERDLIAEEVRAGHRSAIERSRAAGEAWAVLGGPEAIEDVTGGASGVACCTHLHIPSGVEIRASVDAWSPEPYRIDVIEPGVLPPRGGSFTRREPWIAEFHRVRAEIGGSP